jgi:hypothetical protein
MVYSLHAEQPKSLLLLAVDQSVDQSVDALAVCCCCCSCKPLAGAGLGCLAVLLLVHARSMPHQLTLPDLQPALLLLDKPGAAFGSLNILGCLGLLAAAPSLGWELWPVTLVCVGLHVVYNFVAYVVYKGRWCRQLQQQQQRQQRRSVTDSPELAAEEGAAAAQHAAAAAASSDGAASMEMQLGTAAAEAQESRLADSMAQLSSRAAGTPAAEPLRETAELAAADASVCDCSLQQQPQPGTGRQSCLASEQLFRQETSGVSEADVQVGICDGGSSNSSSGGGAKPAAAAAAGGGGAAGLLQERRAPSFGRVLRALPYEVRIAIDQDI